MSTRFDILDAKARLYAHACDSQCNYPCRIRIALSAERLSIAGKWGIEPGDDARQREQFHARVSTKGAS